VISSPKDRREQEGYQNSGSFGENRWGDFAGVNPVCTEILIRVDDVMESPKLAE
jgi:hypothetical protein